MKRTPPSRRLRLAAIALSTCASAAVADDASRPPEAQVEQYLQRAALVGFGWVDQPLNRIVLVRGPRATCAIRFVSYRRANDARPSTSFDTGDASEFATYEVSELRLSGAVPNPGPVARKALNYRGLRGVGRLAFRTGNTDLHCGRERYTWMYPTGLMLKDSKGGAAIAPTNWTDFSAVRMDHPKLRWFQADQELSRPMLVLPLDELPP
jgi:hypothetical protein